MDKRSDEPREESGALRLAALLRKDATHAVDGERDQKAWQRLLRAAHAADVQAMGRPKLSRAWLLAPLAGAALLAVGLLRPASTPAPLHYTLDGRAPTGDYLVAEGDGPQHVDFSDGSRLVLRSSGRLRVTDVTAQGATMLLERGQVDIAIRHRASCRWRLVVGPYTIQVTGTRFVVTWHPEAGDLGVDLLEGAVAVAGPGIATPITVQGGQQFRANQAGSFAVQQEQPGSPEPSPHETPRAEAGPGATTTRASGDGADRAASRASLDRPACEWTGLVAKGQFATTVSRARTLGVDMALAECPPKSLFALADAARYQGDFALSQDTLLAIRKRSPGEAAKAAFFLGRLAEARGNLESALGWYGHATEGGRASHFTEEAKAGTARVAKRLHAREARRPSATVP